jgi:hypothetical protein
MARARFVFYATPDTLEPLPLPSRHDQARVQIKPIRAGVTTPRIGRLDRLGRIAQTTKAGATTGHQGDGPLHGRRRQPRQDGRLVRQRVGGIGLALSEYQSHAAVMSEERYV